MVLECWVKDWSYCLCLETREVQLPRKREATDMDETVLAPADQEERACGLREGLAGALPKVQCKLWVNDLIPIIPMCTFCNTSLVCVEKREGIFYGCSSSTSGRRLLILNALSGGSTLQGDFWPSASRIRAKLTCPVLTRAEGSGRWVFGVLITGGEIGNIFGAYTSSTSNGRFLIGAEQRPMMNQGDGILVLNWSVLWWREWWRLVSGVLVTGIQAKERRYRYKLLIWSLWMTSCYRKLK